MEAEFTSFSTDFYENMEKAFEKAELALDALLLLQMMERHFDAVPLWSADMKLPDWVINLAAWGRARKLSGLRRTSASGSLIYYQSDVYFAYADFFDALVAGWRGDLVDVEMFLFANEV